VEREVVERWVNIPSCPFQNKPDAPLGDPGAVALIVPQRLRLQPIEANRGCQRQNQEHQDKGDRFPSIVIHAGSIPTQRSNDQAGGLAQ